jgi:hypothetical protein
VPGELFQLNLGSLGPHEIQSFRLYFAVGSSLAEATSGFAAQGATQLSQAPGETTFVFGYALGASPVAASAGGGGSRGGGGGGGGGGNGGKAAAATRGMTVAVVSASANSTSGNSAMPPSHGAAGQTPTDAVTPPNIDAAPAPFVLDHSPAFSPQATPELDSFTLMSVGGLAAAGLTWLSARRRRG